MTRRDLLAAPALLACSARADTPAAPAVRFPEVARDRLAVSSYPFRAFIDTPRNRARNPGARLMPLKDFPRMVAERFNAHRVELLGDHILSRDPAYLAELLAAVRSAGSHVVNIPASVGASVYDPDPARRATAVANAKSWVDTAVALDCPSVRIHIQKAQSADPDLASASESLATVARYAASKNVVINLENDDPVTENAFFIAKIIDRVNSPWLRALPDFCNSMLGGDGQFNYRAVEAMFRRACNIAHVKDAEVDRNRVFRVDLTRTFGIARAAGYRGYFSIEFEGEGDPYEGTERLLRESARILS